MIFEVAVFQTSLQFPTTRVKVAHKDMGLLMYLYCGFKANIKSSFSSGLWSGEDIQDRKKNTISTLFYYYVTLSPNFLTLST